MSPSLKLYHVLSLVLSTKTLQVSPLRFSGVSHSRQVIDLWEAGLRRSVHDATVNGQVLAINKSDAIALVYSPGQSPGSSSISESKWYKEQQDLSERNLERHAFVEEVVSSSFVAALERLLR